MKELTSARGWEYAYRKRMEDKLARCRQTLEQGEGRDASWFNFLCGQIRGISEAIDDLDETQREYRLDEDADLR